MNECLFCKIISGTIPAKIVFENESIVAFEDIEPQAPFHIIIIPKKHIPSVIDISDDDLMIMGTMYQVASEIAREFSLTNGFRLVINYGKDAGQVIQHIHIHMLGKRELGWPPG
ncbi:TPA: HIT domain-containing protein [bacterium]|nr:HIT domain-containing protein [bacterium]